jgi:hypothetical protein
VIPRRASRVLPAIAALFVAAAAPGAPPVEDAGRALARLDSLQSIVRLEEARVRRSLGDETAWTRLARAWFQVGDHDRAAASVERARALGARTFDTRLLAGRIARSEGRLGEAIEWLERAARTRPDDWEAAEDLGLALYLAGRLDEAADRWEGARALPGSGSPERAGLLEALRRVPLPAYRVTGRGRERLRFERGQARGALVVRAAVNGRGPFLLRIDTGSPEVVLGRTLARELDLTIAAGGEAGATVGERPVRFDYAVLDSLTLGATALHGLPVAVSDHPGLGDARGVRGTLGFEALRRFRFVLDFPDSALSLEPMPASARAIAPASPAPGARPGAARDSARVVPDSLRPAWLPAGLRAHRLPYLLRGTHLMVVSGRVGQGPERTFVLDSGTPGIALGAPVSTLAEAGVGLDTTRVGTGETAAGQVEYLRFPLPRLCAGSACRDSLEGIYGLFPARLERNPGFRVAGLISQGFLSRYRFGVDPAEQRIWLIEP